MSWLIEKIRSLHTWVCSKYMDSGVSSGFQSIQTLDSKWGNTSIQSQIQYNENHNLHKMACASLPSCGHEQQVDKHHLHSTAPTTLWPVRLCGTPAQKTLTSLLTLPKICLLVVSFYICIGVGLVSWCFEPSQPLGVTSGLQGFIYLEMITTATHS